MNCVFCIEQFWQNPPVNAIARSLQPHCQKLHRRFDEHVLCATKGWLSVEICSLSSRIIIRVFHNVLSCPELRWSKYGLQAFGGPIMHGTDVDYPLRMPQQCLHELSNCQARSTWRIHWNFSQGAKDSLSDPELGSPPRPSVMEQWSQLHDVSRADSRASDRWSTMSCRTALAFMNVFESVRRRGAAYCIYPVTSLVVFVICIALLCRSCVGLLIGPWRRGQLPKLLHQGGKLFQQRSQSTNFNAVPLKWNSQHLRTWRAQVQLKSSATLPDLPYRTDHCSFLWVCRHVQDALWLSTDFNVK